MKQRQKFIKHLAAFLLGRISNPEQGIGKKLFDTILSLVPQVAIETVVVDSIENPQQVLVTPRNDRNYPNACHLPGGFLRYSETFADRLHKVVETELGVQLKNYKDIHVIYNRWEKTNRRHLIGIYFLVEISAEPAVPHQWVDAIPENMVEHHQVFLRDFFSFKPGPPLWEKG